MCRWLAYSGSPVLIEEVLYKPEHSLIDQSLHSRMGAETTNGDGFGLGWYAPETETPAVFHSIEPAWNDRNLREVASHVESPLFLAHIRASSGTAVQQTNCHPFRYGKWLWVHNGLVRDFHLVKRDLALAVDESLYADMEGSADSKFSSTWRSRSAWKLTPRGPSRGWWDSWRTLGTVMARSTPSR
jgi:predicted glutamine amidotransferase